ncbi:acyltransferase [Luteibacter sp. PPL201]|jgi:hypothetical protein|uniref:Acyltransferase n=1 Tax=Luteibacter sahnii TaxID=3021977 RepID=A0ABT6BDJ1_9GAMM|nr:acyltransferase [Luteibacter sp. PPL193]MDY1549356.1 acyltransferase [Luteibacter sp. PPL193]
MHRRHDIDALRVLAFGLLILYHLGMLYVGPVDDWRYHLKSSYLTEALAIPMLSSGLWRMDLLFLISGLAFHFLGRGRSLGALAVQRTRRLLLPLVFGMAVVIPVQPYVQAVANGSIAPGFFAFLGHYYTGGPWPRDAFDGWQYGFTWNHLWYLPYLWLYTMMLLALMPALRSRPGQALLAMLQRTRGATLVIVPALFFALLRTTLEPRFPITHALVGDLYAHARYLSVFLMGFVLGTHEGLWAELARLRRVTLGLAAASFALFCLIDHAGAWIDVDAVSPAVAHAVADVAQFGRIVYMWTMLLAVLGWGHVLLNRPFRWLPYAREAVYPWYILHQSVLLAAAGWLLPMHLGPVVEPLLVLLATVGGCALLHEGVIRRVGFLRPCFGLEPRPATRRDVRLAQAPAAP